MWEWFAVKDGQEKRFREKYREKVGLKDLQRIFLMMLMDVFN